jgi:PA14 domain
VVFTRKSGNEALLLIGSRGANDFAGILAGWGGKYAQIEGIKGSTAEQNPSRREFGARIKNGKRHSAVLEVRMSGLRLLLDGALQSELKTDYRDLQLDPTWKLRDPLALGLGAFDSVYVIHSWEILEIDGQSRPLRGVLARKAANGAAVATAEKAQADKVAVPDAKRDAESSVAGDYAALSDDAYAAMSKGNVRAGKEILEKMLADARFAGLKSHLENDLALAKVAEANSRGLVKGALALADNRPFSFQQTTGKAVSVGRGTKNTVKEATETLITIEQDFGGGKALTKIAMEQLSPQTRFELVRFGTEKDPDGGLNAALGALLMVRSGQGAISSKAIRAMLETGIKTPAGEKLAAHISERIDSVERESAAEQTFHKVEQAVASNKMDDARKMLDAFNKDHAASAFFSRKKGQIEKLATAVDRALFPLSPGLVWDYCQPDGGDRFKTVKVTKVETKLNFDWGDKEPVPGAPRDFSARASGVLRLEKAGRYGFWVRADDYGLVKIDGQRVVEANTNNTGEGEIELSAGDHAIEIEFQDTGGPGVLQVRWRLVGVFDTQDIPENVLFHDPRKPSGK